MAMTSQSVAGNTRRTAASSVTSWSAKICELISVRYFVSAATFSAKADLVCSVFDSRTSLGQSMPLLALQ